MIEIIVMIGIGSVVVLGIVLFSQHTVQSYTINQHKLDAVNQARLELSKIDNMSYDELWEGTRELEADPDFPGLTAEATIQEITSEKGNVLKEVRVQVVSYEGGSAIDPVEVVTYRQSHLSYGDGV